VGLAAPASAHERGGGGRRPVRELFAPDSWTGQWEFRIEYRDRGHGRLVAVEEADGVVCPGDRLGLSSYLPMRRRHRGREGAGDPHPSQGLKAGCEGVSRDSRVELQCASRFTRGECHVDTRLEFDAQEDQGRIAGTAEWRVAETEGNCDELLAHASLGQTVVVSGVRTGTDLAGCSAPPASLIEKLVGDVALMALLPRPIDGLTARGEGHGVSLRWTAVRTAAAYEVLRALPDRRFERIARMPAARGSRYRDRWLRTGQLYRYVVRWIDAEGRKSPASDEASAMRSKH
jgi:hypothetical protein